jgi:Arc/MetJ-type ribon-helix-helix transcriptional regulator
MEIELTPEQDSLVNLGIEQGRIQRREDAVRDAMTLWEKRERARIELLAELEQFSFRCILNMALLREA